MDKEWLDPIKVKPAKHKLYRVQCLHMYYGGVFLSTAAMYDGHWINGKTQTKYVGFKVVAYKELHDK